MKDLLVEDVAPIYRKNYWDRMKCDDLPRGLDLCLFDFGVNAGTSRSAKFLQRLIGTTVDGGIGPNTIRATYNYIDEVGLDGAVKNFQKARQEYYENLKTFETFVNLESLAVRNRRVGACGDLLGSRKHATVRPWSAAITLGSRFGATLAYSDGVG